MDRRDFLKLSATAAAASGISACGSSSQEPVAEDSAPEERTTLSACLANCHATCPLVITSVDGVITKVSPETTVDDGFDIRQQRPCLRGHSAKQKIYNPDRVLHPLKRVGPRGSGEFEQISWEQAFQEIAQKTKGIYDTYGSRSVFNLGGSVIGGVQSPTIVNRLLNLMGGYTGTHASMSFSQVERIMPYMYGSRPFSSVVESKYSDLHVFFGWNPKVSSASGSGQGFEWQSMRGDTPLICFDPRYSDTMLGNEEQHHFIRPGTDAALCEAMAHHLITTDQIDREFLTEKCYGFWAEPEMEDPHNPGQMLPEVPYEECYEAHILGIKDGRPKTPEWAAPITGVPAETIRATADRIAQANAPYIMAGWTIQRQLNGEDNIRAISTLALMVGAVGKRGTTNGDYPFNPFVPYSAFIFLPTGSSENNASVPVPSWPRAIKGGEEMTVIKDDIRLPAGELDENGDGVFGANAKAIWVRGSNPMGQQGDSFKIAELLSDESDVELIVAIENHMGSTAMHSDYVLPEVTWYEQQDLPFPSIQGGSMGYMIGTTAIPRTGDTKSTWEICQGIAREWGIEEEFTMGMTEMEFLNVGYQTLRQVVNPALPETIEEVFERGILKFPNPCDETEESALRHCAMYNYVQNGEVLNTASGKIDIYSHRLRQLSDLNTVPDFWLDDNYINAIAKYMVVPGGYEDVATSEEFPLQLINLHAKSNVHACYSNSEWLAEAVNRALWISPNDANGISTGDKIIVESPFGKMQVEARITNRVMPGVVAYPEGHKFTPQGDTDIGGNLNSITTHDMWTPVAKGTGVNTARVRIYKA